MPAIVGRGAVVLVLCLGLALPVYAGNNVFMSITGPRGPIQGDPKSPHGSQWIPVAEFDESIVSPRDPQSGLATGKRQHQPIKIVKEFDKSSPQLQRAMTTGEHLKEVVFQFYRNSGGKEELYETIRLTDALISSFQTRTGGSAHGNRPTEEITFQYEKVEFTHAQQKPAPGVTKSPAGVKPSNTLPH
jgi:type VI secretion system Hcp family effector